MNLQFTLVDLLNLSPLLILLAGALIPILLETFGGKKASQWMLPLGLFTIAIAFQQTLVIPPVDSPLITHWIAFDSLSHTFTLFFLLIAAASLLLAAPFLKKHNASQGEFYFFVLIATLGLIFIGASADLLTLFLGLETLSISLYVMCAYMKKWKITHEGALKYFFLGALAAAFFLYGTALIYGATGTTQFEALLSKEHTTNPILFLTGAALITISLAFKAAVVPFHNWAPEIYEGSPMPVTAFMAVGTKVGAYAALIRLFLVTLPHFDERWNQGIALLAAITLIYANFVALRQTQLQRFFAYSGIAHSGFLLIPFVAGDPEAISTIIFYLVVYAFASFGSFAVISTLNKKTPGVSLNDLQGLFHRAPFLGTVLSVCLLTLAGFPPTAGFFAKFYTLKLAYQSGYFVLLIIALLTSVLAAYYYLRIINVILKNSLKDEIVKKSPFPYLTVGAVCLAAIVTLSCFPLKDGKEIKDLQTHISIGQ